MIGRPAQWPNWPEFNQSTAEGGDDLVGYKQAIIAKFGQEALTKSWIKICDRLKQVTDGIAARGTSVIPELEYEDLFRLTTEERERLKEIGCFKVKDVIDQGQVDTWFKELKQYVADNQGRISGWPTETPFILNLYYSAAQMGARSHPRSLAVARELNSWWGDSSSTSSSDPLSYADGVRIRPPGVPFYGLGPHIDAGSLCRWADPTYQDVYADVFSGNPEKLNIYDLGIRQHAQQAMFPGSAHSRVFRSFQGWTALSPAAPGEGSLMLYPNVKASIAYVLLRPFFKAPDTDDEEEILDGSKWTFDPDTPWFPGTFREDSQLLSPSSHPHLRLKECLVSIPAMKPGDTIWWHADMCHAVEVEHNGKLDASVAYIAATPSTEVNKKYIKAQLEGFLAGVPPEDFRSGGTNETVFKGYPGEKAVLGGAAGRDAMGFNLIAA